MKAILAFVLLAALMCPGCIQQKSIELDNVQVTDYKGEKLGSVDDFRENSIAGPQNVDIAGYRLEISGLVDEPQSLTYEQVLDRRRYSKVVQLDCVEGWSVKLLWEGIGVEDLLSEAGPRPEANTAIFYAYDGYSTTVPLDYIRERDILLAYKMNNATLPPERGYPFQLVAEDKWGYKWIKWVTKIELTDDPDVKGYWEKRGYSQSGDLDKPKRD